MRFAGSDSAMAAMFGADPAKPRFDQMSQIGVQGQSKQRQTAFAADAYAEKSDINAAATIDIAKANAEATKAAGAAQGQASAVSGIAGGIGSMFGSLGSLGGGMGAKPASVASMNVSSPAFTSAQNSFSSFYKGL